MTMAAAKTNDRPHHVPVMAREVVAAIAPRAGGVYVDATAGGGGHVQALLEACAEARIVAFDRDEDAVAACRERFAAFSDVTVMHAPFSTMDAELEALGIEAVDGLVADLGISTMQLDGAERGMSFRYEGPIDMRMDRSSGETALELVERLEQDELANVIYQLGEERRSRRVARCIKQAEERGELRTTLDLRRAVVRAVGPRRVGGIDPATRTFQALRIAVNAELDELAALLEAAPRLLVPGGTAVFISFHSLEDRLVKRAFLNRDTWKRLSKKPVVATAEEQSENPRSRSAKLRAARRRIPDDELSPPPPEGEDDSTPPPASGDGP